MRSKDQIFEINITKDAPQLSKLLLTHPFMPDDQNENLLGFFNHRHFDF